MFDQFTTAVRPVGGAGALVMLDPAEYSYAPMEGGDGRINPSWSYVSVELGTVPLRPANVPVPFAGLLDADKCRFVGQLDGHPLSLVFVKLGFVITVVVTCELEQGHVVQPRP